jgi:hypothetical protein
MRPSISEMTRKKYTGILFIVLIALSCRKPFTPAIASDSNHYLVIEGVVNTNDSTFIRISRTQKIDTIHTISPEANAVVTVESDANNTYTLNQKVAGIYAAASLNLDPAHKYRLRVKTTGNKEYVSDFVPVKNSPAIDSIGFIAGATGVQIYANTHDSKNATQYYRWEYNETWQFHSMYVSAYKSNGVDSLFARKVSEQVYNCFGNDVSSTIVIASTARLIKDIIYQAPITVVPSTSEKIETKYSILVKQYALTSDAYTFWLNLQNNTEKLGSIFDVLPSDNLSNYHCVNNPNELVVGYLSVGGTSTKRIFISAAQLPKTYSPVYPEVCEIDTAFQNPPHGGTLPISGLIPANSPYTPVFGLYLKPPNINGTPTAYTYSTILCVDCTIRGNVAPPPFWK